MIEVGVTRVRKSETVNHNPIICLNLHGSIQKRFAKIEKAFKSFSYFCDCALLRWIEAENGKRPNTGWTGEKKRTTTICLSIFQFNWLKPALNRSTEINAILEWYLDLIEPVYFVETGFAPKAVLEHKDIPADIIAHCIQNGKDWQ